MQRSRARGKKMNVFDYRICATAARTELLFSLIWIGSHKNGSCNNKIF